MAQNLIKVNYEGEKCTGLYLADDDFGGTEITKETAPQTRATYKLVMRQTVTIQGKGKVKAKETYVVQNMTFLQAIRHVINDRPNMRQRIIDKTTGVTKIREEKAKADFITVDELWQEFYEYKTTTPSSQQEGRGRQWTAKYNAHGNIDGGMAYIMASAYKTLIQPYFGDTPVMQLRKKELQDHLAFLVNKQGYSESYAQNFVKILRPMIERFFDREEIDKRNPANITLGTPDNARNVEIPFEDIQKLYNVLLNYKDPKYKEVFKWLVTGRRIGEVLTLKAEDIHGDYYTVRAENNKAKKDMTYSIPSTINKRSLPKTGYIHRAVKNPVLQLTKASVDRHWINIKKATHLWDLHIHDLRHIINTTLEDSMVPLEIRSQILGHTGAGIITNRYSRITKARADNMNKAVDFFLAKVIGTIRQDVLWNDWLKDNS